MNYSRLSLTFILPNILMDGLGQGTLVLKRIVKRLCRNVRGIILGVAVVLVLLSPANAQILQTISKNDYTVRWVNYNRLVSFDRAVKDAPRASYIVTGTFFDTSTGKVAFAKYTRNLEGFYGVTLVHRGEILFHARQQGYTTLDLNSFTERLAIGFKPDGTLVIYEAVCPLVWMAYYLKALGCSEAVALDGGSSVGVWIDGKTIIKPRRKIANIYVIYHK
jgi:hypothetical protein